MIDMGPISFYLGLKVSWDHENKTIKFSQPVYIDKILTKFHLDQANISNTSMKESPLLLNENKAIATEQNCYQEMTGSIIFSMIETRPDIAFEISVVSRFTKNSFHQYSKVIKTVL